MKAPLIVLAVTLSTILAIPNIIVAEQITSVPINLPSIAKLKIRLENTYYRSSGNQFIEGNEQLRGTHPFECVEFAYGRAIERGLFQNKQGIGAVLNGDAHTWIDRVTNSRYRSRVKNTVRANSFVVWAADLKFQWREGNTTYTAGTDPVAGHVAFVEKVYPDGSFVISEMSRNESQPIIRLIGATTPLAKAAKFIYL
jgi:surface antigen